MNEINIKEFCNEELCDYALYRTKLRIPQLIDGFAETQRKIIFTMMDKNMTSRTKTADLGSIVSLHTKYHHGDQALKDTISNLVPAFNNNLPLLKEDGAFGCRSDREASAPRYTETRLQPYTKLLFNEIDNKHFVNAQESEGQSIEPEYMIPILPLLLINGQTQTAMGYSCKILPRNIFEIIKIIKNLLTGKSKTIPQNINPFIPKFNGIIEPNSNGGYLFKGIVEEGKRGAKIITEVPPKYTRETYMNVLEDLKENGKIKSYKENIKGDSFWVEVKGLDQTKDPLKELKLLQNESDNLTMVDTKKNLKRFNAFGEVLHEYIIFIMEIYRKRKVYILEELQKNININESKIRFITDFNNDAISIKGRKRVDVNKDLKTMKYLLVEHSYNYLLSMQISSLTFEKIQDLQKEIDKMKVELQELQNKPETAMWLDDIQEFEKQLKKERN